MMVVGLPGIDFATDLTLIVVRAWHAARQKEVEANRCYQEVQVHVWSTFGTTYISLERIERVKLRNCWFYRKLLDLGGSGASITICGELTSNVGINNITNPHSYY